MDLSDDLSLYEPVTTTTVPAADLPERQREAVLGHQLRSYGDAADLVRSLEEQAAEEPADEPQGGGQGDRPQNGDGNQPQGDGNQPNGGGSRQGGSGQQGNDGGG